jgi:hypothetical protein
MFNCLNHTVAGKSTLLAVLGNREVPIPEHIDIFHLTREMPASDKTALQCVMEVDEERIRLEKLAEELVSCDDEGKQCVMCLCNGFSLKPCRIISIMKYTDLLYLNDNQ